MEWFLRSVHGEDGSVEMAVWEEEDGAITFAVWFGDLLAGRGRCDFTFLLLPASQPEQPPSLFQLFDMSPPIHRVLSIGKPRSIEANNDLAALAAKGVGELWHFSPVSSLPLPRFSFDLN